MGTLAEMLVKVGADITDFNSKMNKVERKLNRSVGSAAMGLSQGLVTAFAGAAVAAGGLGIAGIKMAGDLEQSEMAFTTLLGSADQAKSFLQDLSSFAARTPFELQGLQDASRKLLGFGFDAKSIIPTMTAVGDAVGALGGGTAEIDRVVMALGQMQAKGKVSAEEMNQMAELGLPVWDMLASKIGVSVPQAMDMASKGAIPAAQGIDALLTGMSSKFGGAMDKQASTINGMFSTLKDTASQALTSVGNQLIETFDLKTKMSGALEWLSQFAESVGENGIGGALKEMIPPGVRVGIMAIAGAIFGMMLPALTMMAISAVAAMVPLLPLAAAGALLAGVAYFIYDNWSTVAAWFQTAWNTIVTTAVNLFNGLVASIQGGVAWVSGAVAAFVSFLSTIWAGIVAGFQAFVGIISGAIQWLYAHNYYFQAMVDFIVNAFTWLQTTATAIWTAITGWLFGVWEGLRLRVLAVFGHILHFLAGIWTGIRDTAVGAWNGLVGRLRGMWGAITDAITGPFERAKEFVSNILGEAWDWGSNLIGEFVDGIKAKAGAVVDAVKGIADKLADFLGFHSPSKEGPGSDADVWAPNLVRMFAGGLERGLPAVMTAVAQLTAPLADMAQPITVPIVATGSTIAPLRPELPRYSAATYAGMVAGPTAAPAQQTTLATRQSPVTIEVPVYLDGKEIARVSAPHMDAELDKLRKGANRSKGVL